MYGVMPFLNGSSRIVENWIKKGANTRTMLKRRLKRGYTSSDGERYRLDSRTGGQRKP